MLLINQLKTLGFRLPIICYTENDQVSEQIEQLNVFLCRHNLNFYIFNASSNISMQNQTKKLGEEIDHVILDATQGIHLKGLLAIIGKMRAGSLLFLFILKKQKMLSVPDLSATAWFNHRYHCDYQETNAPLFFTHFFYCIEHTAHCVTLNAKDIDWEKRLQTKLKISTASQIWSTNTDELKLTQEQSAHFENLIKSNHHLYLLSAERGRGKSFLIKNWIEFLKKTKHPFIVTGARKSLYPYLDDADHSFLPPDQLSALIDKPETNTTPDRSNWLIVDEAAMIPFKQLKQWFPHFKHILLATTLEGYEGSGLALIFKLKDEINDIKILPLTVPIRFNKDCPLEQLQKSISFTHSGFAHFPKSSEIKLTIQDQLRISMIENFSVNEICHAGRFYQFFKQLHYQTTPNDLRRIFDGKNQLFVQIEYPPIPHHDNSLHNNHLLAGAWVLLEGGADMPLAKKIWSGERRPKANLVAQSLANHGNNWLMPTLNSLRISRIGVNINFRRNHLASRLVSEITRMAQKQTLDFVSVSFGFEPHLLDFWLNQGFYPVHISHHPDASSGNQSVMMIFPTSEQGKIETALCQNDLEQMINTLKKISYQHPLHSSFQGYFAIIDYMILKKVLIRSPFDKNCHNFKIPFKLKSPLNFALIDTTNDSNRMILSLCGFAFHHRSFIATLPTLLQFIEFNKKTPTHAIKELINKLLEPSETLSKERINTLKKLLQTMISEHYPSFLSAYNKWRSDASSSII